MRYAGRHKSPTGEGAITVFVQDDSDRASIMLSGHAGLAAGASSASAGRSSRRTSSAVNAGTSDDLRAFALKLLAAAEVLEGGES